MVHVVLENVTAAKKFKAKNNVSISYVQDSSLTHLPVPDLPEGQTYVVKVSGILAKWTITFDLISDVEDLSIGTNVPAVTDIWKQIDYLSKYFVTEKTGETHRITIQGASDLNGATFTKNGAFNSLSIEFKAGEGEKARATIDFFIGTVI